MSPRYARYAQVCVAVPVEGPFTYRVPEPLLGRAVPGARCRVAFGRRRMVGVIVSTGSRPPEGLDPSRIKPLIDCLDPGPILPASVVALCRWVADTYMASWGEVLRLAVPTGKGNLHRRRVRLTGAGAAVVRQRRLPGAVGEFESEVLEVLGDAAAGLTTGTLAERLGAGPLHGAIYALDDAGLVEVDDEWSTGVARRWQWALRPQPDVDLDAARVATERAPAQRRAVEVLWSRDDGLLETELVEEAGCSASVLEGLVRKGLAERFRRRIAPDRRQGWRRADGAGTFELTGPQREALREIEKALEAPGRPPVLLHGVTGSGKTEVYLRAARTAVASGRTAILLVPEIGLTPQLSNRARQVLGDAVAVLHSGLPANQRLEAWWRVRRGDADVVIGPRSSVFAPLEDLGLVVVDEEQDGAYKQSERPRYHGRDVALARARIEGAATLLGSATPAVETYERARSGDYRLRTLPDRVGERPLPEVRVVDMREEWRGSGRTLLSGVLEEEMEKCLARGEQALVLLNRRGFAAALLCRMCGERIRCPECAVSLTLHRRDRALRCHYCDHRMPVPEACPQCGAGALHRLGHGTERLQNALAQRFPAASIGRFDADETRRVGAHDRILGAFARGEWDVLVGTQMLAKGHDFPAVTLVGIVDADASLGLPDFRAAERTFQLLTQMAGRAGRGDRPGRVFVQAFSPDHYAIEAASGHDYDAFFEREIGYRRRLGYPPFLRIVACVCRADSPAVAKEEADLLAAALREVAGESVRVLGPASSPLAVLRGRHRVQILLKGPDPDELRKVLAASLDRCSRAGDAPRDLVVDVDPVSLM